MDEPMGKLFLLPPEVPVRISSEETARPDRLRLSVSDKRLPSVRTELQYLETKIDFEGFAALLTTEERNQVLVDLAVAIGGWERLLFSEGHIPALSWLSEQIHAFDRHNPHTHRLTQLVWQCRLATATSLSTLFPSRATDDASTSATEQLPLDRWINHALKLGLSQTTIRQTILASRPMPVIFRRLEHFQTLVTIAESWIFQNDKPLLTAHCAKNMQSIWHSFLRSFRSEALPFMKQLYTVLPLMGVKVEVIRELFARRMATPIGDYDFLKTVILELGDVAGLGIDVRSDPSRTDEYLSAFALEAYVQAARKNQADAMDALRAAFPSSLYPDPAVIPPQPWEEPRPQRRDLQ
jgi:hypothetical protein